MISEEDYKPMDFITVKMMGGNFFGTIKGIKNDLDFIIPIEKLKNETYYVVFKDNELKLTTDVLLDWQLIYAFNYSKGEVSIHHVQEENHLHKIKYIL